MCGIVGFASNSSECISIQGERLQAALESLSHRGPDGKGQYQDGKIWLGHTRLIVLDLSEAGNQPMRTHDGRFVISYNGEVYNFRELVEEVGMVDLASSSDTEVVLRLFAENGIDSLIKLNGMFSFSIYDKQLQRLWLVRDRLGIKPLYYRFGPTGLVFASEIKAIHALTGLKPVFDISSLHEWLYYGNVLGGRTLYQGIMQVLPGHYLELDLNTFQYVIREYWSLPRQADQVLENHNKQTLIAETCRLLEQAVRRQLVSDVPVGVFLSGGVDSSAITAFASMHYKGKLTTFSAGFDFSRDGGELPKAKRIAKLFGTDHHEMYIAGSDIGGLVEQMIHSHDMPFSDAANIPLFLMASDLCTQVKVVLQGDGGDELFGGYRRYSTLSHYHVIRKIALVARKFNDYLPETAFNYRIRRYINAFSAPDLSRTMALLLTIEDQQNKPTDVFSPQFRMIVDQHDPFSRYRECQQYFSGHDIGNQMSFVDLMIALPDIYLEKVDRSTMSASHEIRVPFLDHDLVDYIVRLPSRYKIPSGKKKWLLKSAMKDILPHDILYGAKRGFSVPFGDWLKTSLRQMFFDHLSSFLIKQPGVLDGDHIHRLFDRTIKGTQDHSFMLWKIFNLVVWANIMKIRFMH